DDRAPGPDGFIDAFFKKACDVVEAISLVLFGNFSLMSFLETILVGFGFHPKMVQWIMVCVSGASYFICVNGNLHGWFKGKRGCVIRMNSSIITYVKNNRLLTYVLLMTFFSFSRGNPSLVAVIMDALEEFKQVSGLVHSIPKSMAFFCNVPNAIKAAILNYMHLLKGSCLVNDWRNKFLSLVGRLQLIRSVLSSIHIYWASIFILPNHIVHDLEQLVRVFLWCQGEMKKGKAKVAWDSVCKPKHEGSLGIRRIDDFDIALTATYIWSILTHRESLWVKWVHTYKLKGRSFWDVPCRGDIRFSIMAQLQVPLLLDDIDGVLLPFLVACAWDTIQTRTDIVNWYNVVWFPHFIPRHAIHMWLVFQQKLKTQDMLRQWDDGPSIDLNLLRCPLCDLVPDSHDHLFFECAFSSQVWSKVYVFYGMDSILPRLIDVSNFIIPISKGKMVVSILSRIVLAATSYYILMERNGR
nr:hypothetical protein [Tanacetum cinerariifolium]